MENNSTDNLIQGASRLGIVLIFGATALAAQAAPVTTQGTWWGTDGTDGTLQARDIAGNAVALSAPTASFFYDTVLNITWLADWNAGAGSSYDDGPSTTDGRMTWDSALDWAAALEINGVTGWRLPSITDTGTAGCNFSYNGTDCGYNVDTASSEMAHLFYVTLGNFALFDTSGNLRDGTAGVDWGLTNTAYFTNMQPDVHWSGTAYAPDSSHAWFFNTLYGWQDLDDKRFALYAVAVRPGDVLAAQAVPEPGTLGLLLAALGVGAVVRRRRAR